MKFILTLAKTLVARNRRDLADTLLKVIGISPFDSIMDELEEIDKDSDEIMKKIKNIKKAFGETQLTAELIEAISKTDIKKLDEQYNLVSETVSKMRDLNNIKIRLGKFSEFEKERSSASKEFDRIYSKLEDTESEAYAVLYEIGKKHIPKTLLQFGRKIKKYIISNLSQKVKVDYEYFPGTFRGGKVRFAYYIEIENVKDYDGNIIADIFIPIYIEMDNKTGNLSDFGISAEKHFTTPDKLLGIPTKNLQVAIRVIHGDLESMNVPLLKGKKVPILKKKLGNWLRKATIKNNKISFVFDTKNKVDARKNLTSVGKIKVEIIKDIFVKVCDAANLGKKYRAKEIIVKPDKKVGGGDQIRYRLIDKGTKRILEFTILAE